MNATTKLITLALLLTGLTAQTTPAQRAGSSPLFVNVDRTKSSGRDQQIGLKITVRNMGKTPAEVRLEVLFIAEPAYGRGKDLIFCERKTAKSFEAGEAHDFNTESDAAADRMYGFDGQYFSLSSLKIKGYITRVFANDQLVNVTGSAPSLQKIGWDDKELTKLGYTGPGPNAAPVAKPTPAPEPTPPVIARPIEPTPIAITEPAPNRKPIATMPRDDDDTPPPAKPTPPVANTSAPTQPAPIGPPTWNETTYQTTAKRYNTAVDAYQAWLAKRGAQSTLKTIEEELRECAADFEKIQNGAPSSYNLPNLITRCRQTIFAIHATMQAP